METDLLGLPAWWCALSVIIAFLVVIFLIYAYHKGRKMMQEKEKATGIRNIRCSECGLHLKYGATRCPGCGADFDEDMYVCPKCGRNVARDDKTCPSCMIGLRKVRSQAGRKVQVSTDPDLAKLGSGRRNTSLQECSVCGALFEPGSICPVCTRKW